MTKKDTRRYLNHVQKNQIDFIKLTPSYFKVLVHEVQHKFILLPHVTAVMLGGENLTKSECAAWLSLYPNQTIYNEYGPTETTVAVSVFTVDKRKLNTVNDSIPIGHLALQYSLYSR